MEWQSAKIERGILKNRFVIIMACFNAESTIARAIITVINQDFPDLGIIIRNDMSTDNTSGIVRQIFGIEHEEGSFYIKVKGRDVLYIENDKKLYTGGNTYESVIQFVDDPYTIIGMVDGDDYLLVRNAVSIMHSAYVNNPDKWLIWSQHIATTESTMFLDGLSHPLPTDEIIYSTRAYWGVSHFRTCLKGLFSLINPEDLYDPNNPAEYSKIGGDAAFLYPMIEMCGNTHSLFIDRFLYYYNDGLPTNDSELYSSELEFYRLYFQKKPMYAALEPDFKFQ